MPHPPTAERTRVVALGASAGGLEALEAFFRHVPEKSGLAFVVIQHQDPTQTGMLTELLQRVTTMPVSKVSDRQPLAPDHVYVIPPNKDMSILGQALHLLDPVTPRGLRLPVDFFFRSLADDRQEDSIGVILSGMGSDGALGLRAIKEKGGLCLVQDPTTAKYDSMPRAAAGAGLADIVAPAEELPEKILGYLKKTRFLGPHRPAALPLIHSGLEKALILLRARTRHDFTGYKKSTVHRRVERRMAIHQIDSMATYVRYLQDNPQEQDLLFKELLIGVTNFFRDPGSWDYLRDTALPGLMSARPAGSALRAWVTGCSTGEEAYSLAMVFREAIGLDPSRVPCSLQIFATDLDPDAIDKARRGGFPANIAADVAPERLRMFFTPDAGAFRVNKDIREMIVFATQNVLSDPPFTKMDILSCRNLLIYLEPDVQKRLLPLFHYSLNPEGLLFLGSAETIGGAGDLFAPLKAKTRIYRRLDSPTRSEPITAMAHPPFLHAAESVETKPQNLQTSIEQLLLRRFAPASVLVNAQGDILYIHGRTGNFLEPAAGKANWNILAMARDGLRLPLTSAFQRIARKKGLASLHNLALDTSGGPRAVSVTLQAIDNPGNLNGLILITFTDMPQAAAETATSPPADEATAAVAQDELERELRQTREALQITIEEMQASQEELTSANEELQSTNEELQSTNEELTTSREEMQSLNEELQTVNAELQANVDELSKTNNDMQNLLNSTEIATIFLDDAFRVRRFTPQATRIVKLIESDVGRPLADLVSDLDYPDLFPDAAEVLRTLVFSEKQTTTHDGRWFAVRIMPYRTRENRIDGVVITLSDITSYKRLEEELRAAYARLERLPPEETTGRDGEVE